MEGKPERDLPTPALSGSSSRVIRAFARNSQRRLHGDLAPRTVEKLKCFDGSVKAGLGGKKPA
jgi:hypothetical protein